MTQSGYEGPNPKNEPKKLPPPESREWKVRVESIGHSEDESVFARVDLDGECIGMIRMPNNEHLRWFRERVQG